MTKTFKKSASSAQEAQGPFVNVFEAAEMLRLSPVSIRRFLGQGKIKKFKVGSRTLLRTADVLALVRESE